MPFMESFENEGIHEPPDLFLHNHHQNLGRPLDAALPVDSHCDTCMDAKAFTDMVAKSEKNFTERVREAEAKK